MSVACKTISRGIIAAVGRRQITTCGPRLNTFTATDAVVDKPFQSKFSHYVYVSTCVTMGLFAGGWMSKNIASFLEENELFVPSDDDDDF